MDGHLPLGWGDMAHWASLTATTVRRAEWRILRAMDGAFLAASREMAAQQRSKSNDPHTSSEQPMTAELFDAIFQ